MMSELEQPFVQTEEEIQVSKKFKYSYFVIFLWLLLLGSIATPLALIYLCDWEFDSNNIALYYGSLGSAGLPVVGVASYMSKIKNILLREVGKIDDKLIKLNYLAKSISAQLQETAEIVESIPSDLSQLNKSLSAIETKVVRCQESETDFPSFGLVAGVCR